MGRLDGIDGKIQYQWGEFAPHAFVVTGGVRTTYWYDGRWLRTHDYTYVPGMRVMDRPDPPDDPELIEKLRTSLEKWMSETQRRPATSKKPF